MFIDLSGDLSSFLVYIYSSNISCISSSSMSLAWEDSIRRSCFFSIFSKRLGRLKILEYFSVYSVSIGKRPFGNYWKEVFWTVLLKWAWCEELREFLDSETILFKFSFSSGDLWLSDRPRFFLLWPWAMILFWDIWIYELL